MSVQKSATFLLLSGTNHNPDLHHLHIVCTDADDRGLVLLVPLRSRRHTNLFDDTCILQPHEHDWLRRESYVEYRMSNLVRASDLEKVLNSHKDLSREKMNAQTFLRIKNGFCRSKFTPQKIKKYLNCPR